MRKFAAPSVLLCILLCALLPAGCGKIGGHMHTLRKFNEHTTITDQTNGVTRKLEAHCSFSIAEGKVGALAQGGVLRLQESGGPEAREAEVRESDGGTELWMKEGGAFRKAAPADELWLAGFLRALGAESSTSVEGSSIVLRGGSESGRAPKAEAEAIDSENLPVPELLAKFKQHSFSHERKEGIETLLARRTLEPADQIAVIDAVFAQLDFGSEQVEVLRHLIRKPGFSPDARKALIGRIDKLSMDSEKVEVMKALLQSE